MFHDLPDHDVVELDVLHVHRVEEANLTNLDSEHGLAFSVDSCEDLLSRALERQELKSVQSSSETQKNK